MFMQIDCISTSALTIVTITIDCGEPTPATISKPIPIDKFLEEYSYAAYLAP
jgi:hypothetical protein